MHDPETARNLEAVVRGIATAAKTLRLYPPSSPMPRQSAEGAIAALAEYLTSEPVLSLAVARQGFTCSGEPVAPGMSGAADFAEELRSHGIAEVDFLPGCGFDELLSLLTAVQRPPEDVHAAGGLSAVLASAGVEGIRVTDVELTVADGPVPEDAEDVDEFLRQLATDPGKLAAWISAAAGGDPAALADGLDELRTAAGGEGARLAECIATAFAQLDAQGKDALLGVAMEPSDIRRLAGSALGLLGTGDISAALCGGAYGENMLTLSGALTRLPLADRMKTVFSEVKDALAAYGHDAKEAEFLEHMVAVRTSAEPEPPLADADAYRAVAAEAVVAPEELGQACDEASDSHGTATRSVATLLALLDQQRDFELYCRAADSLAATVPVLLRHGDLALAGRVISELHARESADVQPWPGLQERLRSSIARAVSGPAMRGLLEVVVAEPARTADAAELVRIAGEAAAERIAEEGVALKDDGLAAAEKLIGRRLVDLLAALAPRIQWYQVGPVARRLATEPDERSREAVRGLVARQDEQSRREAAKGLGDAGPTATAPLAEMLHDRSAEVAIVAVRSLARGGDSGAAHILAARLAQLDVDGRDFLLAREIVIALARIPGSESGTALRRLAGRRTLIRRGHFAEVQQLAHEAVRAQAEAGAAT